MTQQPIAITGMHRSGTSMLTRGLHDSGLHLLGEGADEFIPDAEDNPEGFWENKAVVACNDDLLEATGGAWDDPPEDPPHGPDDPRVRHLVEPALAALAALGQHDHWGFKDPRTCLTAAFWLGLEPDLRFVVCVRNPLEVALSLKRRNQNSYALGLSLWERYYGTVLAQVPPERRLVTHFDAFFRDPQGELERVCAFAGLEPAPLQVRDDLRHHEVDVGLGETGVDPSLRRLYGELCEEGSYEPAPEPPPDEGRVRRLVLDGVVARRHADQRQAAIERLQEREAELRRERAASEAELRGRIRTLEAQLRAAGSVDALREAVTRNEARLAEIATRVEGVAHLAEVGVVRRAVLRASAAAAPTARAVDRRLPPEISRRLRRVARATPEGVARRAEVTVRQARATAVPKARAVAGRLPAPVKDTLGRAARVTPDGVAKRAESAARRLPAPAQEVLRRRRPLLRRVTGALPSRRGAAAARGPSPKQWYPSYERLVAGAVPEGEPWLVVVPGSPARVCRTRTRPGTPFPAGGGGDSGVDLGHIAQLEARRYAGDRYLVVPEGSRPWFRRHGALRDHVTRSYGEVADEPGAGAVFDLEARPEVAAPSLRAEITRVAGVLGEEPAVLDWTARGVAAELPGVTTFRPPGNGSLPYADASVDVVVVEAAGDVGEARRVASTSTIAVDSSPAGGARVVAVDGPADPVAAEAPRCLVWSADPGDDHRWRALLEERTAAAGADLHLASLDRAGAADWEGYDVVVVLEPLVVPLPSSIEVAASLAAADAQSAVAGKVITADGRLEAAGGTVFADRSAALIGSGCADVRAPWHEYVRPVCWAPGLVAASSALWNGVELPGDRSGRDLVREWCGAVWAAGGRVRYQPLVSAVRLAGAGDEPASPMPASAWHRVVDLRPARPRDLSDGTWRYLLAHDDVEGSLG